MTLRTAVVALAVLAPVRPGAAQVTTGEDPQVVVRETRERWIQGGQHPGFIPFESRRESIHVQARGRAGPSDWWYLDVGGGGWEGSLRLDARNRLLSMRMDPPSVFQTESVDRPGMVDPWQRHLMNLRGRITAVWEVPFVLPPRPLTTGATWSDTLSFSVEPKEALVETLDGVWKHEVVGDTLVDGRSLPLVRTVADVRRHALEPLPDAGWEGDLVVERTVSGTIVGLAAVDTALGLRATGVDSTFLTGVATLRLQDGRAFDAPLRYERVRSWRLTDSTAWAATRTRSRPSAGGAGPAC